MKKLLTLLSLIAVLAPVNAQVKKPSAPAGKSMHLNVFNQSLASGDMFTAISSLNYYIIEQGGNTPYCDTLAMLYMQQGAYPQCFYWADKRLKLSPDNVSLMEMKALSLDKLQQPTEAIELFDKLYKKTQSPFHAYKLMELQYSLKRLLECAVTAQSAERLQFKPEYIVPYTVGQQQGRTYLQSAIYNIHGLALYDLDKKPEAKAAFEKALQIDSTFALAKQNLEAMRTLENQPKTNGNGATPPVVNPSPGNKPNQ